MEENKKFTDEELIEEVSTEDDAPVEVIYRCAKCGQILSKEAKDCWKCSSKEIEEVVEEETKETGSSKFVFKTTKMIMVKPVLPLTCEQSQISHLFKIICFMDLISPMVQ